MSQQGSAPFEVYREQLIALESGASIAPHVGAPSASFDTGEWKRIYGRFHPGRNPYASMVYAAEGDVGRSASHLRIVEAFDSPPDGAGGSVVQLAPLGWLRVAPFSADPALPTLPAILRLPGLLAVLRYRPGRRCTFRLDRNGQARFGKIFCDDAGARQHQEGKALEAAAAAGWFDFQVAAPLGWDADTRCLWQSEVPGVALDAEHFAKDSRGDLRLTARAARAAASLALWGLREPQATRELTVFDRRTQLDRGARDRRELLRRAPMLERKLQLLSTRLEALAARIPASLLLPVHGSLHAKQWLDDGKSLGLVDFEKFSLGEPELDVGTFLAELDSEDPGRIDWSKAERVFLDAFRAVGAPLREDLLLFYRAQKRIAKTVKSVQALRADGPIRAERNLDATITMLLEPNA